MVTAWLQQPLLQDDITRWLDTDDLVGTPMSIPTDELLLAWSHFDYTYAAIDVAKS